MDAISDQQTSDSRAPYIKRLSDSILTDPGIIQSDNRLGIQGTPSGFVANFDTVCMEKPNSVVMAGTELARKFCEREAAFIELDEVVGINITHYIGHVYDLQSDLYSLYSVNGIIVSNCHCWPILVMSSRVQPIAQKLIKVKR